jgi:hypothetical protein|tara:strand:- start:50 stop:322 length:273 start_codon:yes stop_codon:yes gene_type:complete
LYAEYFYPEARFALLSFQPAPTKRLWIYAVHRVTQKGSFEWARHDGCDANLGMARQVTIGQIGAHVMTKQVEALISTGSVALQGFHAEEL